MDIRIDELIKRLETLKQSQSHILTVVTDGRDDFEGTIFLKDRDGNGKYYMTVELDEGYEVIVDEEYRV